MAKVEKLRKRPVWTERLMVPAAVRRAREDRRSIAVVGAERIVMLAQELGEDEGFKFGWRAHAADQIGLARQVLYRLLREYEEGVESYVGRKTIDRVCKHIGCAIGDLLDDMVKPR